MTGEDLDQRLKTLTVTNLSNVEYHLHLIDKAAADIRSVLTAIHVLGSHTGPYHRAATLGTLARLGSGVVVDISKHLGRLETELFGKEYRGIDGTRQ